LTVGTKEGVCLANSVYKFNEASGDQVAYICQLNTAANGSVAANSKIPAGITTSNLLVYKRNAGGSIQGVAPVVPNNVSTPIAPIAFLNLTSNSGTCTVPSVSPSSAFKNVITCPYDKTANAEFQVPTFGISDVNPQIFTIASENSPAGTVPAIPGAPSNTTYQIVPGPAVTFGVVVTTKLRNALQEAQFDSTSTCNPTNAGYTDLSGTAVDTADSDACMPNLSRGTLATIFAASPAPVTPLIANVNAPALGAGKIKDWSQLKVGTTDLYNNADAANKPGSAKVHICSRTIGSGTKAQFGLKFLGNVCNSFGSKVVQNADYLGTSEPGQVGYNATVVPETALRPMVHAMSTGGGLSECLNELDSGAANSAGNFAPGTAYGAAGATAVRWAIGFVSLDNNATQSNAYRFIKIDGAAPTLANVANGTYPDWVEGTFQYNTNVLPAGNLRNLALAMMTSFTTPSVLSYVNANAATQTFGVSGFLTAPSVTYPASATGKVDPTAPVNPLSYAINPTTGGNATNDCRTPAVFNRSGSVNNNTQGLQIVQ
jgi:hypothetical protein